MVNFLHPRIKLHLPLKEDLLIKGGWSLSVLYPITFLAKYPESRQFLWLYPYKFSLISRNLNFEYP